ncbi:ABC transporter permease [Acidiluteibacter ferrifornacis]|uniref:FtsX-like permease family protein n=1 Tax=Acidiluteibacter ferrifornacis TaxID=2692424 RepID=A0A6N9NI13_9FLAO|nr:FtsX-like permease family protein [Acidiluteibacter ferrifornacis]NBG66318.1 FtsX-like permease family protein [Acidiluteibacter ferrifornacis]
MNYPLIFSIAKTHLVSRFKQSAVAALGVTFGIGTFITMIGFMTGLNDLLDGLVLNRTPHVHLYNEIKISEKQPIDFITNPAEELSIVRSVQPKFNQIRIHNALPILDFLNKDKRVKGAIPQIKVQVFYKAGAVNLNGILNGIEPLQEDRLFNIGDYVIEGNVQLLKNTPSGIILGAGVADKLKLSLGDRIYISSPNGALFQLKIVGIYQSGLAEVDDIQSYVNVKMAQRIMGQSESYITDINVKLHDLALSVDMASQLSQQFNVSAIDINAANAQFDTGTSIRNIITYAVSITLLIVAGFGIYNILNMLIYEKMNDIAILKATGFSGKDVQYIFITQAMVIGIIGGSLGLIVGFLLSVLIDNTPFKTEAVPTLETFPVNFDPVYYIIGIIFALIATFLAGYLPSRKAKNIDPVEIIRGQ